MYSSGNSRPIYGDRTKSSTGCACTISPTIQTSLQNFITLVNTLKLSIERYMPASVVNIPLHGNVSSKLFVPPIIMTRLLVGDNFPQIPRDKNNFSYRSLIKDYYYKLGSPSEWANDPLSLIKPSP